MSIFVIRGKCFGYNDEVFYTAGHRIATVLYDQAQAEQTYKALEIDAARNFALYEVDSLFNASEDTLKALDAFVFECCGQHIFQDGEVSHDHLPEELSDDDTFEFIKRANMQSYQLIQFEDAPKFYVLWSTKQQALVKDYDEYFTGLLYESTQEEIKYQLDRILDEYDDYDGSPLIIKGSLAELSDLPSVLQSTVNHYPNSHYDEQKQQLSIKNRDNDALYSINALLKQPLFEIRTITLDEIQDMEAKLSQEEGNVGY